MSCSRGSGFESGKPSGRYSGAVASTDDVSCRLNVSGHCQSCDYESQLEVLLLNFCSLVIGGDARLGGCAQFPPSFSSCRLSERLDPSDSLRYLSSRLPLLPSYFRST